MSIYIDRQIHTWQTSRHTDEHTQTYTAHADSEARRGDIKFKHKAIMSLSRFTHVSVLIWNPPPHYPHSILLLIKYLLEFRWHWKYRCFISQLFFSLDFNYSYSTFGWCAVRACEMESEVNLSDFRLVFSQFYYSVRVSLCCSFCGGYGSIQWHANTQATGSTAIFFLIIKETNHENYTICEPACGWLGKKSVYDGILLPFCLTIFRYIGCWKSQSDFVEREKERKHCHCLT